MKSIILALIFLGLAGYGSKIAYERFYDKDNDLFEKNYVYPEKITVRNQEGTKIQVTLLGRSSKYVKFRKKDGREFIYSISSLDEQSQTIIMKYPENGVGDVSSYLSSGGIELKDVYATQLEEEILRIEEEIKRLQAKASATQSRTELRTIDRQVQALEKEISEMRYKLSTR